MTCLNLLYKLRFIRLIKDKLQKTPQQLLIICNYSEKKSKFLIEKNICSITKINKKKIFLIYTNNLQNYNIATAFVIKKKNG